MRHERIRKAIKAQLQYIRRNLRYINAFLEEIDLCDSLSKQLTAIRILVEQQQYMYDNKANKKQEYMDNNDRIEVEQTLMLCSSTWFRVLHGTAKSKIYLP